MCMYMFLFLVTTTIRAEAFVMFLSVILLLLLLLLSTTTLSSQPPRSHMRQLEREKAPLEKRLSVVFNSHSRSFTLPYNICFLLLLLHLISFLFV